METTTFSTPDQQWINLPVVVEPVLSPSIDTNGYLTTVESSVAAQLVLRLMEMVESSGGVCLRTLFVSVATETFPQNVDICR